ncbi:hypothetical protein [Andreprevotia chitinilytica]|uniref:hypothetical protein n=1 Tax=Andreprevotia chitinilytica TaxID=396808 RepID=UPI00054ED66D|nr:hypothetical protein [Andreprevotia chitinilytica]
MFVFELTIPGTWLDSEDQDWKHKIENLIRHLESQFIEANVALNLFNQAQTDIQDSIPLHLVAESWQRDQDRRAEIRRDVEREMEGPVLAENWHKISFETEIRFKREQWMNGQVPRRFTHVEPFIFARAFLYALDAFDKFLGVLAKENGVPAEIATFHQQVSDAFPDLRGVRNSAQHLEDRARGLGAGRNPKPMELQPIQNAAIYAPQGGVLALNNLNGSRYGSTTADGHYGEVDVSPESLAHLQRIFEGALNSFKWCGPQRHIPDV